MVHEYGMKTVVKAKSVLKAQTNTPLLARPHQWGRTRAREEHIALLAQGTVLHQVKRCLLIQEHHCSQLLGICSPGQSILDLTDGSSRAMPWEGPMVVGVQELALQSMAH